MASDNTLSLFASEIMLRTTLLNGHFQIENEARKKYFILFLFTSTASVSYAQYISIKDYIVNFNYVM